MQLGVGGVELQQDASAQVLEREQLLDALEAGQQVQDDRGGLEGTAVAGAIEPMAKPSA